MSIAKRRTRKRNRVNSFARPLNKWQEVGIFFKKKIEINIRLNTCTRRAMQDCRVWESPIFLFLFTIARHQWEHQNAYFSLCVHFALALFHSLSLIPSHCDFANEYMILILWELRQSIELNHHSHKHIRRNVLFQISLHWNYVVVFSFSIFFLHRHTWLFHAFLVVSHLLDQ